MRRRRDEEDSELRYDEDFEMRDIEPDTFEVGTDVFTRLTKDRRNAAKMLKRKEARFLVDLYYAMQKFRIQAGNMVAGSEKCEPTSVLRWVLNNANAVEADIKSALGVFAKEYAVGAWMQGICGIGPVISAGFLSALDIREAETVGHWWRFAGLDPTMVWVSRSNAEKIVKEVMLTNKKVTEQHIEECAKRISRRAEQIHKAHLFLSKGKKKPLTQNALAKALAVRPWNARLKTLCFKVGESFVKQQNKPSDFYGKMYVARKELESQRNEEGYYKEQAELGAKRVGKSTKAYKSYSKGLLPKGHLHSRARRHTVKMFLSHLHHVAYVDYYDKEPPVPFAFTEHCEGDHRHFVDPPDIQVIGKTLVELYKK